MLNLKRMVCMLLTAGMFTSNGSISISVDYEYFPESRS